MESYSDLKNKDIMNFAGKWMELENTILSEVTDPKRYSWYVLTNKWVLEKKKVQYTQVTVHRTQKQAEVPK